MTNPQEENQYRPISRKYLRYLIEGLNQDDTGPGIFAQLAERLIHRRKYANIVPATEPSAGGDDGQDARTHKVFLDSDGRFRLYSSPPTASPRLIFAFGISPDWKTKLHKDVNKIVNNQLNAEGIVFVTNQFIHPEHIKIDAEREIHNMYGIPCEILDGQWILSQLYDYDYSLAEELLGCPPENDPRLMEMFQRIFGLKEGGLSEDEAITLERLKNQVQYRNRYTDSPEHLMQDLRRIGNILAPYEEYLEEAIKWYEEALPVLDNLTLLPEGIELLYAYFKALLKLPYGPQKILKLLPRFIDLIFRSEIRGIYYYISIWLDYLHPYFHGQLEYENLYTETSKRIRNIDRSRLGVLSQLYLDEVNLYLDLHFDQWTIVSLEAWVEKVNTFLLTASSLQAFPLHRIAGSLGALAPKLLNITGYSDCFELALKFEGEQEGGFHQAITLRNRALAHEKAGQINTAIVVGTRSKLLWFNEKSMRGYLLTSLVLSVWYRQIGYIQAAEDELMESIHLMTWQPAYMNGDLLAAMVVELASLSIVQGRILRAYRWLLYYYPICSHYRVEPKQDIFESFLQHNLGMFILRLYTENKPVHDRLLELADRFDPNLLLAHKEIVLSSDNEFELWLQEGLTDDEQIKIREMRQQAHNGDLGDFEGWIRYNELADEQYIEWGMPVPYQDNLLVHISYPSDRELAQIAFTLSSSIQIWSIFLHNSLDKLMFADDSLYIRLSKKQTDTDSPYTIEIGAYEDDFSDTHICLNVALTTSFIDQVADLSFSGFTELFLVVTGALIDSVVLDPQQDVLDLFDPSKSELAMERLRSVASPIYLWRQAPLVSTVLGDENAY